MWVLHTRVRRRGRSSLSSGEKSDKVAAGPDHTHPIVIAVGVPWTKKEEGS